MVTHAKLKLSGKPIPEARAEGNLVSIEAVITAELMLIGLSARQLSLWNRRRVNLLAVSRQGHKLTERLSEVTLRAGDVLLLQGSRRNLPAFLQEFSCLPLAQRDIMLGTPRRGYVPLLILAAAMGVTAAGLTPVSRRLFLRSAGHGRLSRDPARRCL